MYVDGQITLPPWQRFSSNRSYRNVDLFSFFCTFRSHLFSAFQIFFWLFTTAFLTSLELYITSSCFLKIMGTLRLLGRWHCTRTRPKPGSCVLWWVLSDRQHNCEFWSWLFNLLYISQVTFIIPFTDGNLKISDWVLSALICMAQICFSAPNNSFFIRDSWSG